MEHEQSIRELAQRCAGHSEQSSEPTVGDYKALENKLTEWGIFGDGQEAYVDIFEDEYRKHSTTEQQAAE